MSPRQFVIVASTLLLSFCGFAAQTSDSESATETREELERALSSYNASVRAYPDDWRGYLLRGQLHFQLGDNSAALEDFDKVVELAPDREAYLWQRGISQYYEADYAACSRQFELHRTVNPNDVENAVWHFLCRTRSEGVTAARAELLPVGPDARIPMREIYRLFRGEIEPESVLAVLNKDQELQSFYANLYIGLYLEALGDEDSAAKYLRSAARSTAGGYMRDVARMHVKR